MFQRILRRAAITRYRQVLTASMVVPRDAPVALSGHPDALRVLVLGSGVASGQGVGTYGLALVGALQRSLQRRLGRPVDVEQVRQHGAGIEHAAAIAESRIGEDWDAFVLAFGVGEALQLTPAPVWRRGLGLLLSTIEDRKASPFRVPVLVAGIPPLTSFDAHQGPLMPALSRHAAALDRITRRMLVGHGAARFVPLPAMRSMQAGRFGSPSVYEGWAEVLAEQLVPMLRPGPKRVAGARGDDAGVDASALLATLPPLASERLQQVAAEARQALDGDLAAVRLVHGDQLLIVADTAGTGMRTMPLAGSICTTTLMEGLVLTEDVRAEPRFGALNGLAAHGIRSYAGVALRDGSGAVVGTLCVLGGGAGRSGQEPVLRRLGREAEQQLRAGTTQGASTMTPSEREPAVDPAPPDDGASDDLALPTLRQRVRLRRAESLRSERSRLLDLPAERPRPALRSYSIPGPDPLWLLMLGGEYAVGYGVDDRADALDGQLARLLHRRTGRGVEVHNRADDRLSLRETSLQLGPRGSEGYDLVVWAPRFTDAARSLWSAAWVFGVSSLIRYVQATSQSQIVLMGFPTLIGHQPLAVLGRVQARRLNQLFRLIAARFPGVRVAEPSPVVLKDVETIDGATTYRAAAVHMFATVIEALHEADRLVEDDRGSAPSDADESAERADRAEQAEQAEQAERTLVPAL